MTTRFPRPSVAGARERQRSGFWLVTRRPTFSFESLTLPLPFDIRRGPSFQTETAQGNKKALTSLPGGFETSSFRRSFWRRAVARCWRVWCVLGEPHGGQISPADRSAPDPARLYSLGARLHRMSDHQASQPYPLAACLVLTRPAAEAAFSSTKESARDFSAACALAGDGDVGLRDLRCRIGRPCVRAWAGPPRNTSGNGALAAASLLASRWSAGANDTAPAPGPPLAVARPLPNYRKHPTRRPGRALEEAA